MRPFHDFPSKRDILLQERQLRADILLIRKPARIHIKMSSARQLQESCIHLLCKRETSLRRNDVVCQAHREESRDLAIRGENVGAEEWQLRDEASWENVAWWRWVGLDELVSFVCPSLSEGSVLASLVRGWDVEWWYISGSASIVVDPHGDQAWKRGWWKLGDGCWTIDVRSLDNDSRQIRQLGAQLKAVASRERSSPDHDTLGINAGKSLHVRDGGLVVILLRDNLDDVARLTSTLAPVAIIEGQGVVACGGEAFGIGLQAGRLKTT